jgi:hypothetical protein
VGRVGETEAVDLDPITHELYGLPPDEFVSARNEQAKAARAAGDRNLASRIAALRKPTVAAWATNQLMRVHSDEVKVLLDLGEELRAGMQGLSGDELRTLTKRRHALVAALLGQAQLLADEAGRRLGPEAVNGVRATLEATLADQASADAVREGCLAEVLEVAGFGFGGLAAVPDDLDVEPSLDEGATVGDLAAHRERKEAAIRDAQAAVSEAERACDEVRSVSDDAAERAAKASSAADDAASAVARLEAELGRARDEAERRTRKAEKRRQQHAEAESAVEEAEEILEDARERLARLSPDKS